VPVDLRLEDGQKQDGFLVIHTPGHTPGSIALLDVEKKLLVAGDSFRTEKGLGPMDDKYNIDPKAHRESIKKLATYDFETVLVGHGGAILKGGSAQVRALAATL
jgi:glyoxylase-like metal-dependent hydrolase (beta-lactamase superfamily II)